ncbi:YeiH family protein [Clostridiisalibacter paucivorans]|uniref:YeiH family protein n=1 Tax=Clostridiisalibacter paucivorans TaxID=408753 RepID=UPI00047B48AF|nr:putative sulfate exporter family transporter [Clostridiisalibacter paucivorans]
MKKNILGILFVAILSAISMAINKYFLGFIETLTIGILLGILISNILGIHPLLESGITFSLKKILKWGIVLLGVKLNFNNLISLGPWIVLIVIIMVVSALILSNILGKFGKLNSKLSTLLGVGSSICGASAIVAMGPVIDADEDDIAISVAIISLLGALGVIIYSLLTYILPLTDIQYGIWAGSSLQGVAHALAAAGARGTNSISMEIGTIVKMARVTLLAPVAMVLSYIFNNSKEPNGNKSVRFPLYVLLFILVGIIFTINSIYNFFPITFIIKGFKIDLVYILKKASSFFILMAMISMGLKVNFKAFKSKALTALLICTLVFFTLSTMSFFMVKLI